MKKLLLVFLIFILTFLSSTVLGENGISLYINEEIIECDVAPTIVNSRTLCPTRAIFDAFGATVSWNGEKRQVSIKKDDTDIVLTVDYQVATVNQDSVVLDSPPTIISDRCMVPIRFISETLGCDVYWNNEERSVHITKKDIAIDNIKLEKSGEDFSVVKIFYNGTKNPNIFFLDYSNCIVMDFYDTKLSFSDGNSPVDNEIIKEVRYAQHEDYSRVVIECKEKLEYTSYLGFGNYTVSIGNAPKEEKNPAINPVPEVNKQDYFDKEFMATRDENNLLVVLDAGHGGKDPGAVYTNSYGQIELQEKDLNLKISNKVYRLLIEREIHVKQTRDTDEFLELSQITDIANNANADLFVSIHINAMENSPEVSGTMVLYNGDAPGESYGINSKNVANIVDKKIASMVDIKDRGIVSRPGLWVLRKTAMPAILIECAFISNEYDRSLLTNEEVLDAFALAIADGIEESLNIMKNNIEKAKLYQ